MDHGARKDIGKYIDRCTRENSGLNMEPKYIKELKSIVKQNNEHVKIAFDLLMTRLKKQNSQVRYLALLVVDELFQRSKFFRDLLGKNVKDFMKLTITGGHTSVASINTPSDLPDPPDVAILLREKSLSMLEAWKEKFGSKSAQIALAYNYLKHTLKMKFPEIRTRQMIEERRKRELQAKTQEILRLRFDKIRGERETFFQEISDLLEQMDSIFDMLVPTSLDSYVTKNSSDTEEKKEEEEAVEKADEEDVIVDAVVDEKRPFTVSGGVFDTSSDASIDSEEIPSDGMSEDDYYALIQKEEDEDKENSEKFITSTVHQDGLGNRDYVITIDQKRGFVPRTEDNAFLFENLREFMREIDHRFLPILKEWELVLIKVEKPDRQEELERDRLLRKVIDFSSDISRARSKCVQLDVHVGEEVKLPHLSTVVGELSTSTDDASFETVPVGASAREREMETRPPSPEMEHLEEQINDPVPQSNNNLGNLGALTPRGEKAPLAKQIRPKTPSTTASTTTDTTTADPTRKLTRKEELLRTAPVVEHFSALDYWDKSEVSLSNGIEREHRFLGQADAPSISLGPGTDFFSYARYYEDNDHKKEKSAMSPVEFTKMMKRKYAPVVEEKKKRNFKKKQ